MSRACGAWRTTAAWIIQCRMWYLRRRCVHSLRRAGVFAGWTSRLWSSRWLSCVGLCCWPSPCAAAAAAVNADPRPVLTVMMSSLPGEERRSDREQMNGGWRGRWNTTTSARSTVSSQTPIIRTASSRTSKSPSAHADAEMIFSVLPLLGNLSLPPFVFSVCISKY